MVGLKEVIEADYISKGILFNPQKVSDGIKWLLKEGFVPHRKIFLKSGTEFKKCTVNDIYLKANFNLMVGGGSGIIFLKEGYKEIYFGLDARVNGESYIILTNPNKLDYE